jgi:hypothetical protein
MRRLLALAAAAVLVAGCAGLDLDRRPRLTRAEADRLIAAMIEETLDAVAPGAPRTPGVHDGTSDECTDNLGAYEGTFKSTISRQVAGLSEATVADAERRVTRLWRDKDMIVSRYPGPPGMVDLQAEQGGVEYVARISRLGHRVTAWGTTPCLRPD